MSTVVQFTSRRHASVRRLGTCDLCYLTCSFVFCAAAKCYSPDAFLGKHARGNCWLKFTEAPGNPEVNMRGSLEGEFKQ